LENKYPCDCNDMIWMIHHEKVFKFEDGFWALSWMELDRTEKGEVNIGHFGVKIKHCPFCGKELLKD